MIIRSTRMVLVRQWFINLFRKRKRTLNGFQVLFLAIVRGDASAHTVEHEKIHIRQWWRSAGLQPLLLLVWPGLRYDWELEAYVTSVRNGRSIESAARALSVHNGYDYEAALEDILKHVDS